MWTSKNFLVKSHKYFQIISRKVKPAAERRNIFHFPLFAVGECRLTVDMAHKNVCECCTAEMSSTLH